VSQKERSIFWEVTVPPILSSVYVHVSYSERFPRYSYFTIQTSSTPCPHASCTEIQLFHCTVHCTLYRRATRHVHTRVAKCIDVDGGIFENVCIILGKLYQLCHLNNKYRY
jgi:hypothetical protein